MKTIALFCIIIALSTSMKVKTSFQLSLKSKIQDLKKTGWGRVAVGMMELQLKTGGPMAELITAFQNLIKDLNFKIGATQEEYRWDKAEHFEIDKEINYRLRDARVRYGVSTAHLENTLYPARAELEHLIAVDEKLIADTHAAIEKATSERANAATAYAVALEEHHLAEEAVGECLGLVQGLISGGASMVQVRKTQKHLKKLHEKLHGMNGYTHLAKALLSMVQEFASGEATQKVYDLLGQLAGNLVESEGELTRVELESIAAYEGFLDVCWTTIAEAEARVDENTAALEIVNAEIAHQEELQATAAADRDQAQADLDAETARWEAYVAAYEDLMAQLMAELDAVDRCIDVFATADLDPDMMDVVDSLF